MVTALKRVYGCCLFLPSDPHGTLSRWAVPIFTLFGLSDLVEVHTGR